jgi:hypothetical protein
MAGSFAEPQHGLRRIVIPALETALASEILARAPCPTTCDLHVVEIALPTAGSMPTLRCLRKGLMLRITRQLNWEAVRHTDHNMI